MTGTFVFEGGGRVAEYIGGYDDWLVQRPVKEQADTITTENAKKKVARQKPLPTTAQPRKLTNKEKQELEMLPKRIETLELEQQHYYQQMADPAFYQEEGQKIVQVNKRLEALKLELAEAYRRWEELEELQARYEKRASGGQGPHGMGDL